MISRANLRVLTKNAPASKKKYEKKKRPKSRNRKKTQR